MTHFCITDWLNITPKNKLSHYYIPVYFVLMFKFLCPLNANFHITMSLELCTCLNNYYPFTCIIFPDLCVNPLWSAGMMIGGYIWGSMADKWGRRNILMWSLLVNGIGNLASSVSQVFWLFLICRFVSGIG